MKTENTVIPLNIIKFYMHALVTLLQYDICMHRYYTCSVLMSDSVFSCSSHLQNRCFRCLLLQQESFYVLNNKGDTVITVLKDTTWLRWSDKNRSTHPLPHLLNFLTWVEQLAVLSRKVNAREASRPVLSRSSISRCSRGTSWLEVLTGETGPSVW